MVSFLDEVKVNMDKIHEDCITDYSVDRPNASITVPFSPATDLKTQAVILQV